MELSSSLTEKLFAEFPHLYRGRFKSPTESSMCFGFSCGDGWYSILYALSKRLTEYLIAHPSVDIEVVQVKCKFGDLRFYITGGDAETREMIEQARECARNTCEICGSPLSRNDLQNFSSATAVCRRCLNNE